MQEYPRHASRHCFWNMANYRRRPLAHTGGMQTSTPHGQRRRRPRPSSGRPSREPNPKPRCGYSCGCDSCFLRVSPGQVCVQKGYACRVLAELQAACVVWLGGFSRCPNLGSMGCLGRYSFFTLAPKSTCAGLCWRRTPSRCRRVLRTGSACVRTSNVALPGSDACPASTASTLLFRKPQSEKARHCTLQALATVARSS